MVTLPPTMLGSQGRALPGVLAQTLPQTTLEKDQLGHSGQDQEKSLVTASPSPCPVQTILYKS